MSYGMDGWCKEIPGGDLISRAEAIDEAYEISIDGQKFNVVQVETLMGLPSAQPKRIRGRWRHYEGELECSQCGSRFFDEIMDLCGDDVPHFCPNCGADMRGEQDEQV